MPNNIWIKGQFNSIRKSFQYCTFPINGNNSDIQGIDFGYRRCINGTNGGGAAQLGLLGP